MVFGLIFIDLGGMCNALLHTAFKSSKNFLFLQIVENRLMLSGFCMQTYWKSITVKYDHFRL